MTTVAIAVDSKKARPKRQGLGTITGVYLPTLLAFFGVIMYTRVGLVVGSIGFLGAMVVVLVAGSIVFLTGLSIASSATNMTLSGGGTYYLLSRAFGKELGASIGIPLYIAQALAVTFCVSGFVESITVLVPGLSPILVGLTSIACLTLLAYSSAKLALRVQWLVFFAVVVSMVAIFWHAEPTSSQALPSLTKLHFWPAFALFFPAVTGVEVGVCMAGSLRNPRRSLVWGVMLAVITGAVLYLALIWHLHQGATKGQLLSDLFVLERLSRWGWPVVMGLWISSLNNGLGGLLGAPRTMQILAQDGVLPRFLGGKGEPRMATLVTASISALCLFLGRLDIIAPLLTLFFLLSYGMLNLAAGLEGLIQNPSWRPSFRIPSSVPLIGAALCIFAMFMINPGGSFLALFLSGAIYAFAMSRSLSTGWDDIRQGVLLFFARLAIYRLAEKEISTRSWRPNFLVLTHGYRAPQSLLKFTSQITHGKGLLMIASLFPEGEESIDLDVVKRRIGVLCYRKKVQALVHAIQGHSAESLISTFGFGPLQPNTVVIGDSTEHEGRKEIASLALASHAAQRNLVVIVGRSEENFIENAFDTDDPSRIDVWWDDENRQNSELMLVLAHMHQSAKGYSALKIHVKCTVHSEAARDQRQDFFDNFFANSRFNVSTQVYVNERREELGKLHEHFSVDANLVVCGLRPPRVEEDVESYLRDYRSLVASHKKLSNIAYVLSAESMDLSSLFSQT